MFIENIIDKDGDGFEYEVTVSDGCRRIVCFAYAPVDKKNNIKLYAFEPEHIRKALSSNYLLEKLPNPFEYKIVARVLDRDNGIAQVFGFIFEFGAVLPKNIEKGDYFEFVNIRMDCETE